jgi:hypothetical protein
VYGYDVPDMKTMKAWFDKILAMGSIFKEHGGAHQSVSEEKVYEICIAFQRNQSKSSCQASREPYVTHTPFSSNLLSQFTMYDLCS